ncbi:MAG TPA: helix-turn-helix domain-containing protein [Prosthecobacter sp.]|nr:helix-turn-helix domain-containing protein [Prosthecobacter sp.]
MPPPPSPTLPAALWRGVSREWLWVYHGNVPRVREWSREIVVPAGVFFVKSGLAILQAGGVEIRVAPGQAFFSAPGPRRQWFEANTRLLSAGLRCQWPDGTPVFSAGLNVAVPEREIRALHGATQRLFRMVHGGRGRVTYPEAAGEGPPRSIENWSAHDAAYGQWFGEFVRTLAQMGVAPTRHGSLPSQRLQRLLQKLSEWPLDRPVNLQLLTADFHLGERRAHDLLRDHLGMTGQAAHERRRLEHARQRLIQEDVALKEIAFGLGFKHPPHFTAWFKRHTGTTPTAYRAGGGVVGA